MQNVADSFETRKRSFSSAFSTCMTVPLMEFQHFNQEYPKKNLPPRKKYSCNIYDICRKSDKVTTNSKVFYDRKKQRAEDCKNKLTKNLLFLKLLFECF